ncbi:MAG: DUF2065 domain-containing protein [Colwellia sp.]|nr:DUF2065 domain-containing protein [Colwellia sp.]
MDSKIFITALALAFIIEGLLPTLFPNKWKSYVSKVSQESASSIRAMGIIAMLCGVLILWFIY